MYVIAWSNGCVDVCKSTHELADTINFADKKGRKYNLYYNQDGTFYDVNLGNISHGYNHDKGEWEYQQPLLMSGKTLDLLYFKNPYY